MATKLEGGGGLVAGPLKKRTFFAASLMCLEYFVPQFLFLKGFGWIIFATPPPLNKPQWAGAFFLGGGGGGRGIYDSPADDVGLHLGHARPLDEVIELTHGGVARQVL